MSSPPEATEVAVDVEPRGPLLLMGLNRPTKRNAFNVAMIEQLAAAYHELENDDELRCGVLFADGDHVTGGLDLAEVGPVVRDGQLDRDGSRTPRPKAQGRAWTTPVAAGRR